MKIKRAYAPVEETDGYRILVDRLWPRGISKEKAQIDLGWNLLRQVMNCVSGSVMTPNGLQSSLNDIVQS